MAARMLAIYGKGGIGKSFVTANLTARLALNGKRTLQLGCDPKHDSCNTIFNGHSLPTLGEVWRKFKEAGQEEMLQIGDVIFRNELAPNVPIYGCEIGGPEVGRGCGGQGISHGFKVLERLGMDRWNLDFIVMDFLGDVVCGGFATPLARSLAEELIIVVSQDRQSLYAANNIARAAQYFRQMGGSTQLLGLIVNRDDGTDTVDRFCAATGIPILTRIPQNQHVRMLTDACRLSLEVPQFNAIFSDLVDRITRRAIPPCTDYKPLEYDEFLRVFDAVEPPGEPMRAEGDELLRAAPPVGVPYTRTILAQVQPEDAEQARIMKLMEKVGFYVTGIDRTHKDGITVTSGATEIRLGEPTDLEHKLALLNGLARSGHSFAFIDVRQVDAPYFG